jgi:hypothetical protein
LEATSSKPTGKAAADSCPDRLQTSRLASKGKGGKRLPSSSKTSLEIDHTQLAMLLSGIDLASAKRRKRYQAA